MASVAVAKLSVTQKEQLAISYAAFVLAGTGAEVTHASLDAVIKASGVNVSAGLLNAVAKALKGKNVSDFFGSVGSGASSAPATQTKAADTKAPKKQQKKKEAPPPPPAQEEQGMDMGGLFD